MKIIISCVPNHHHVSSNSVTLTAEAANTFVAASQIVYVTYQAAATQPWRFTDAAMKAARALAKFQSVTSVSVRRRYWPGSPLRLRACSLSLCPGLPRGSSGPLSPPRCPGAGTGSHLWSQSAGRAETTERSERTQYFDTFRWHLFPLSAPYFLYICTLN